MFYSAITILSLMPGITRQNAIDRKETSSGTVEWNIPFNTRKEGSHNVDQNKYNTELILFPHSILSEMDQYDEVDKSMNPFPNPISRLKFDYLKEHMSGEDIISGTQLKKDMLDSQLVVTDILPEEKVLSKGSRETQELSSESLIPSTLSYSLSDLLKIVLETIIKEHDVIILHDNHPQTQDDITRILMLLSPLKLIAVNIANSEVTEWSWLGDYNDGMDIHIILFREAAVVEEFVETLPERLWAPSHLLLINGNYGNDAAYLLGLSVFSHCPYLTLLQLNHKITSSQSVYQILVYESFKERNKVVAKGSLRSQEKLLTFDRLFPDRFESFHGYHFHLSSWVDDFPYLVEGETLEDTYGMCIYMLDDIAHRLNFTYQVYPYPEDHLWGDLHNGSWRGMIGEVWREERDFCINVMTLVEDRFHAVDFSVPYFLDSDSFVIRNPLPPPRWWSIVFPFSWYTWIAVCLTLLAMPICLLALLKLKGSTELDVLSVFLEVTKIIVRQDAATPEDYISIRIFIGVWWLTAMVLSISYTGNLIAFITIPAKAQPMKTLYELAQSDLTPVMIDYGNFMPTVMKSSGDATLMTLGEKLQLLPNTAYQQGFDMVEQGTAAFIEGTEYFRYMVILFQASNTYFLEEVFFPSYVGWIYPKKTAWKHKFDVYLQRFVEAGLPTYWRDKLAYDFKREMNLTRVIYEESVRPLNLSDLQGAFAMYGLSLLFSLVVGALEMTVCSRETKFG